MLSQSTLASVCTLALLSEPNALCSQASGDDDEDAGMSQLQATLAKLMQTKV